MIKLLDLIRGEGLNSEELAVRLGVNSITVKKMVRELKARGNSINAHRRFGRWYYDLDD